MVHVERRRTFKLEKAASLTSCSHSAACAKQTLHLPKKPISEEKLEELAKKISTHPLRKSKQQP